MSLSRHRMQPREIKRSSRDDAVQPAVAAAERHSLPLGRGLVPRRRRLLPRLLAAVIRSSATLAFATERQVVGQTAGTLRYGTAPRENESGAEAETHFPRRTVAFQDGLGCSSASRPCARARRLQLLLPPWS